MSVSVRGKASEHCKGAGVYLPFLIYLKEIFLYGAPWCKFFKKVGTMLGVILLYVGMVLMSNGFYRLEKINDKSNVVMNIFTGGLGLILNLIAIGYGAVTGADASWFYASATGLLFAFTYLYTAINTIWDLDQRLYGWFSLFVAINSIPAGLLCFFGYGGNMLYGIIWWLWGILWLTAFIEINLKKNLGNFVPYLAIFEGIVTAWIPGFLMLVDKWPK